MVGVVIFYILSAVHDYYVWEASAKSYSVHRYVEGWHTMRFLMELTVFGFMAYYATEGWFDFLLFLAFAGWTKLTVFNILYNFLKEQKWYYLSPSSNLIDRTFKPVEKQFFIVNIIVWLVLIYFNLF